MDPFYIKTIQFFLSLSLLIVLHELGHFIPARLFKTRVEKFYLFFDLKFSLFKKKIGDTVYGIGWIPLGGYVKIAGMIDESMDKEQMAKPPQPWEFRSKPAWQRLIIMLGGVTVNVLLGFFIYMMILLVWGKDYVAPESLENGFAPVSVLQDYGFQNGDLIVSVDGEKLDSQLDINRYMMLKEPQEITVKRQDGSTEVIKMPEDIGLELFEQGYMQPMVPIYNSVIDSVLPEQTAQIAGLKKGDSIVKINDQSAQYWHEFTKLVQTHKNEKINVSFYRNGNLEEIELEVPEEAKIGVISSPKFDINHKDFSFGESFIGGFDMAAEQLSNYAAQFKYVFTKKGATQVGGFGAIGGLFPDSWNWIGFWETTAFISLILAFMNILPIPALDGGHVMFLLYEMISGRKPNEKVMEYAQMIGFFILIALVLYANGNDVYRWLFE